MDNNNNNNNDDENTLPPPDTADNDDADAVMDPRAVGFVVMSVRYPLHVGRYIPAMVKVMREQLPYAEPRAFRYFEEQAQACLSCPRYIESGLSAAVLCYLFWSLVCSYEGCQSMVQQCEPASSVWSAPSDWAALLSFANSLIDQEKTNDFGYTVADTVESLMLFHQQLNICISCYQSGLGMQLMSMPRPKVFAKMPRAEKQLIRDEWPTVDNDVEQARADQLQSRYLCSITRSGAASKPPAPNSRTARSSGATIAPSGEPSTARRRKAAPPIAGNTPGATIAPADEPQFIDDQRPASGGSGTIAKADDDDFFLSDLGRTIRSNK